VQSDRDNQDDALFDGAEQIVFMIGELFVRKRPDEPLPILSLVRSDLDEHPGFLAHVSRYRFQGTEPLVPHAYIDLAVTPGQSDPPDVGLPEATQEDVAQVRCVLLELAGQLEERSGGRYRLDRFRDVVWLMSQTLPADGPAHKRHAELRKRLRQRARGKLDDAAQAVAAHSSTPWYLSWPTRWLFAFLALLWYRTRHNGRYRWFLRQPNLAPGDGSFIDLATKLTADQWPKQVPEQVLRIMVNSLLEDLRVEFRGKGHFRRYRTAYPVALLNHVTRANGGYHLLRAVNDIRNDTGLQDPLLLISCSKRVPPHAFEPDPQSGHTGVCSAAESIVGLRAWQNRVRSDQQSRSDVAWYLPILLKKSADDDAQPPTGMRLDALPPLTPPPVPIVRNRAVTTTLIAVLIASAAGGYVKLGFDYSYDNCGPGFIAPLLPASNADNVVRRGDECVGITDGSNTRLVPAGSTLNLVRNKIYDNNSVADQQHSENLNRPLITLVFVGALTPTSPQSPQNDSLTAEGEQLAGLALAQDQQLRPNASGPIVKVLIANAGRKMGHGEEVADRIGELARKDPSIVAAIGFNETRQDTIKMIMSLARAGLPVVAATLSADELSNHPMYFQVSPQNRREAEVAAAYAAYRLPESKQHPVPVHIYYDPDDIYSYNLAEDASGSFGKRNFTTKMVAFAATADDATTRASQQEQAGRDACQLGKSGVAFYAGRPLPDFQNFIRGVSNGCKSESPLVIAGDAVTRYIAHQDISKQNTIPFSCVSFAIAPSTRNPAELRAKGFYDQLSQLFDEFKDKRKNDSLDGHAALTYDAAQAAIIAAGYLATENGKIPVTGGTLWWALASINNDDNKNPKRYDGVTGPIDFGTMASRRFPPNKPVYVLQVTDGRPDPDKTVFCGNPATKDETKTQWCPLDHDIPDVSGR
jgi:hypothetical protein